MSRPNYMTTASEDMCPSRTMNSTKNVMNLSNYVAGSNDQSFDFTSNRGLVSGKYRGSYNNIGNATRNQKYLLNKNASNASPKFSSNFGEGYETEGTLKHLRPGAILLMGEDTGYGTDDFADIAVPNALTRNILDTAASTKNFGQNRLTGPRTPTAGPRNNMGNQFKRGKSTNIHLKQNRKHKNTRNLSAVPGGRGNANSVMCKLDHTSFI